jgi:predicted ATP-grasp superfamily ATP-dependent carboligase
VKGRVLVAGFATRHVAQSAYQAGYEVCAVDHFCDQDLSWYTRDREKFEDLEDLPDAIDRICRRHQFDLFIPTSGAETLSPPIPLCGTPPNHIARFLDKLDIQYFFESLDIPVPRILPDGEYPAMVKSRTGAGGWRNAVIGSEAEMIAWNDQYDNVPHISQELVPGTAASVCCIATGSSAMAVTTNEQILRGSGDSAFGFSGSITPFDHPRRGEMIVLAERVAAASGCRGTVGIDFVVSDNRAVAIEVNPRFQGTVDTVEMASGCNLFDLHVGAFRGHLPARRPEAREVAARSILFADSDMTLNAHLGTLKEFVADIPWPGTFFEKDQAIVSVYGRGPTRDAAITLLDKHISTVRQYMR